MPSVHFAKGKAIESSGVIHEPSNILVKQKGILKYNPDNIKNVPKQMRHIKVVDEQGKMFLDTPKILKAEDKYTVRYENAVDNAALQGVSALPSRPPQKTGGGMHGGVAAVPAVAAVAAVPAVAAVAAQDAAAPKAKATKSQYRTPPLPAGGDWMAAAPPAAGAAAESPSDFISEVEARLDALDYNPESKKPQEAAAEREAAARSFVATHHSHREPTTRELIHWAIMNGFNPDETLKKNHRQNIERYFGRMAVPIPLKYSNRFKDMPAVRPPSAGQGK